VLNNAAIVQFMVGQLRALMGKMPHQLICTKNYMHHIAQSIYCSVTTTGHITVMGKTTVSVLHNAQLLLNKQQQFWGGIYIQ